MKRKSTFLRMFALLALMLPWTLQAQNAKVSEYDGTASTATYSSIAGTSGAVAWTPGAYVDVSMPFAMYFGETNITAGSTLRVYPDGSASFTSLAGSRIAPLYYSSGYTTTATSIYTRATAQQVVVEWRKVVSGTNSYSFQLKLYPNGDIEFCYGPMTISSSINVLVGMMSSDEDIYGVGGANGTNDWSDITRNTSGTTRALSSAYSPAYNTTTGQGVVYTFTQPACVKPSSASVSATAWNTAHVEWTVANAGVKYVIAYSTEGADFNAATATPVTVNSSTATSYDVTGLSASTQYWFKVSKFCDASTQSGWTDAGSVTTPSGCPTLSAIGASDITATGATISWTSSLAATSYDVRYNLGADFDPEESEGTLVNSTTTSKAITGLTGSSTYYYYVKANCVSGLSTTWYGPYTFNTACGTQTLPYAMDFEDGNLMCWTVLTGTCNNNNGNAHNGSRCLRFIGTTDNYVAMPLMSQPYANLTLSFWEKNEGSSSGQFAVGYMTDLDDVSTFHSFGEYTRTGIYTYHEIDLATANIPAGAYIVFRQYNCLSNWYWFLDDVQVTVTPTCPEPRGLAATNAGVVTWDASSNATSYELAYSTTEATPTAATVTGLTATTYTVPGLTVNTTYYVYLRAVCSATNEVTEWVSTSFTTGACLDGCSYALNMADSYGDGWNGGAINFYRNGNLENTYTISSGSSANYTIDVCTGDLIEFSYAAGSYAYENSFTLVDYENTTLYTCTDGSSMSSGAIFYDGFACGYVPTCFKPNNLAASGVTSTEATLTWTEVGASTQWEVKYGPAGFNPDAEGVSVTVNATPTVALSYLNQGTTYDVYVRAICDPEGPTEWSNNISFSTPAVSCLAYSFDGDAETITIGTGTSTSSYLPAYSLYDYSFTQQIYTADEIGGSGIINSIAFDFVGVKARNVEIYIVESDKTSFSSTSDWVTVTEVDKVFTGTIGAAAGWQTINFTTPFNYSGNGSLIVTVNNINGSWSSGLSAHVSSATNKSLYAYRDNTPYSISNLPSGTRPSDRDNIQLGIQYATCIQTPCNAPDVAIALSDAEYAATLTFTNANDDETTPTYGLIWGPQGFNPRTSGTVVSSITSNTYTLSNLAPLTSYDVYVYAVCGGANGDTVRYGFTTPFIPDCKVPNTFASSNVTYTNATVSWNQPGSDVPENWTVRYAATDFNPATAAATDYTEITVPGTAGSTVNLTGLNNGNTYYIYVMATCNAAQNDVSPEWGSYSFTTPTLQAPANITVHSTNITADFEWDDPNTIAAQSWTVRYATADFDAATAAATEYTEVVVNEAELSLAALAPGTKYYIYFSSNYGTEHSAWVGGYFSTLCPEPVEEYVMTSNDATLTTDRAMIYDNGGPDGDYSSNMNQTLVIQPATPGSFVNLSGEYSTEGITYDYAIIYNGIGTEGTVLGEMRGSGVLDVTSTDPTGAVTITFRSDVSVVYWGWELLASTRPCDPTITCIAPATASADVTTDNVVTLSWTTNPNLLPVPTTFEVRYDVAGTEVENCANVVSNITALNTVINSGLQKETEYVAYILSKCGNGEYSTPKSVTFTTNPTCWTPNQPTLAAAVTPNSVKLSWTNHANSAACNRWEVIYGPQGFDTTGATPVMTTNNTEYEIAGLHHSTSYDFYVRAVCTEGSDYSDWSPVRTVTTACGPWTEEDLPIVENFDSYGTSVVPNCWNRLGTTSSFNTSGNYAHSGNRSYYLYRGNNRLGIMPELDESVDVSGLTLDFYAYFTNAAAQTTGLKIGVLSSITDSTTFVEVATVYPTAVNTWEKYSVSFENYTGTGRFVTFRDINSSGSGYIDDVTLKVTEHTNLLADNGQTVAICGEYVMPDTTNGGYHGGLNTTYVVRPAEAGNVAHLTGSYNLENGYDFLNVYRGAANANNLVGRYTGNGPIDYVTTSNLWADSGYFTLVLTTDADNAFSGMEGFKLLVSCECPQPAADVIAETDEANGTYTWRNGETYNNNVVRTGLTYDATAAGVVEPDLTNEVAYTYTNVAGCDSVSYSLNLTVHPTYSLTYNAEICERDTFLFYGQKYAATGTYTVALTSQYGADSTGILNLQVNPAPLAYIYSNNRQVSAIDAYCDGVDLALEARSNNSSATFEWEDESTAASRIVNPHESNTYTVIAVNPTTSCTSLPATLTVTTVPVPELSISGDAEICYGESTTLTLADANNVEATYRWSTGATGTSITVNPTATTTYTVTATTSNASACTATASLEVVVNALPVVTATASVGEICRDSIVTLTATQVEGYSYSWNTGAATAVATTAAANTGVYTVTVTDQNGCQNEFQTSTVTVYPSYELSDSLLVCYTNNPYTWGAQTITANGNYDQNFTIGHGCDSLVHLTFTFEEMGVENSFREVCEGTSVTWGDQTIAASETTLLTYVDNTGDCPVQKNLNLVVNHPAATAIEQTVCDTYTWAVSGETYTESGAYPYTLATTKGCDSVVTLNLTVNYQNTGIETVTVCDSYVWDLNGQSYTATTNEPTFTLQNQWGCDSVVTLDLTVNYRSYHEDFHCVRDAASFTWIDGETYNLDVNVTDGIEYVTGENADGCNEIAQLHLVLNPIINTLNWITVDTCDEYEIPNAVVFNDENDCQGHIEPLFISESGDYEVRTRPDADVYGQDELTRVHLTINQSSHHTTVVTACLPYEWLVNVGTEEEPVMYSVATITADMVNGASVYNMSYEMPQQYSNGCSSIEILRLTPKYPTVEVTDVVTICQNGSWTADNSTTFYGSMLDLGENILTWDDTELNAAGCPMTKQVNLTVNPVYNETANLTFCESEFVLNADNNQYEVVVADANHDGAEVVLTIPGALNEVAYNNTVVANWQTALGCDSIVTITYTVNPTTTETEVYTVCYRDNFEWDANGETYSKAGNYVDTVVIANEETGCTLNRVLNLTVLGTYVFEADTNVCTTYEGPDGVTYRETRTFDVPYVGTYDETQYCDAVTRLTYVIHQSALNHQYVVSNRPYTWKNGQTFSQSVENVYYDVPIGEGCDSVLALHFTMVDPITFCDDAFPYETGINDIAINTSDIVMDTASFCLDNSYAGSIGGPSNLNWGIKFEANRPNDKYKVYGAQLYYVGIPGAYSLRIYTGGDAAPATLVGTKTITFSDGETTGWKYFELDEPLNIDNSNLWVTFHGDDLGYPISCVQYYDENDQNGAWVSTDGTYWESLNSNNNSLFYSFMIKTVYSANIWRNNDPQGNDTILYYTVNPTYNDNFDTVVCDSYVWDGTTYTESGVYTNEYTSVNGCDSTVTMNVTIKNSTAETVTVAVCDSYTWADGDGETYTESGNYTWTTTNLAGCDSVVTLALTINVNEGVELTETACATYTWDRTGLTYTNTTEAPVVNDYTVNFADANGCVGDSVLHLTLNPVNETNSDLVLNEAASYTYLGVMYTAPYDGTIDHTFTNQYGCDSIDHLHLIIPVVADDQITEVNVEACGSYTWTIAGVEHTYEWIPMSERQSHGMAMYKDVTANQYVYTYPTDTTFDANGVMTAVRVLHLNLLESTTSTATVNVPVSLGSYDIVGVAGDVEGDVLETVTFTYADRGTTMTTDPVGVGSVAYCDDFRTYTINIIDNYDTTEVYACADETSYTWNEVDYTIGTPGHTFWFSQVENAGTMNELVHVLKVNQRAVNATTATATACDSYTWTDGDGLTYTTSGTYIYNYTDDNQCAATNTLTLTVNYNSNTAYTDADCDTYTWTRNNQTYTTSGDYTYSYTNADGCASTDTLHLTINNNSNQTFTATACNSYVWAAAEGGDGLTYTTSGTYTYNYNNTENGCPSVNTLNLTINLPTNVGETVVACDSIEWNGTKYYVSGDYEYDYTSAAGCASTDTLHLTVNAATHNAETMVQCDSYEWNGTTYTESGTYNYSYTNAAGCASVDTLYLTINVNTSTINDVVTACDEYTWAVNDRLYNASGSYTARTTDVNGCATTNTLELTINHSSSYDSILYVSDGSYRYTYQDQHQELFGEGVYNLVEMYTNAAGCDSTLSITLNVGTALLGIDNVIACREYTWRNGETYVYIDAAERAANPNTDNVAPLYKTSTGTYIYYNPTYTVVRENNFDSIYMLALTLNESYQGYFETTVNVSEGSYNYVNADFGINTVLSFADAAAEMHNFVNTDSIYDVDFVNPEYCGGVMTVTLHLVNNYQEVTADAADICVSQDSYTWRNHTISTATTDYDNAHTYYVYDTLASGIIEYITVNQHPITYTTERRTACDSYEWYGNIYTESTTNATEYLPAGTIVDGEPLICDHVATLILVINHNTSTTYDVPACETYTWTAAEGGNGETYTESGTYTYEYETAAGCPSVNTLNLTINHNTSNEYTVDACDSYTWTAEEGGNGTVYTTASPAEGYTFDYLTTEGCPSTNTLHLTIRSNSNETFTETACDSYTWTAEDGGDGETYTTSGVYTYDYEAENGCPSVNTLNLTINANSSTEYTLSACDSYTWHGTEYTASGDYTYDYADANNCASEDVLHLTINASTHNSESVVACQSYTWHGTTYTNPSSVGDMFYGTYEFAYVNEAGCYSVDTLYLTLGGGRTFSTQTVANCGPYTWIVNDEEVATLSESVETSTSFLNPRTGCDSVVFLYLTIFEAPVTNLNVTICDNELPYTWTDGDNTTVLTEAGEASVTYPFSANCDSTVHLTLTVNPTKTTALTDQICLGNDYNANGFVIAATDLPAAGEYTFTQELSTYLGCDSIVTLTLTVGDIIENPIAATACDSYIWNAGDGETYEFTASGTYNSEAYANATGCTTVDVLTLTINQNAGTEYTETVCDAYMWNGTQYTESGDYTYDYTDGNGCASTDILHLTVNNSAVNTIEKTVCDSYTWEDGNGENYNASGVYTYNYTTVDGCNGTDYLVLTVNQNSSTGYTATACDSYVWNGNEYTESGDYTFDYEDVNGCSSVDTLHLTVNQNSSTNYTETACDSYTWNGTTYTTSGDYTYQYLNTKGCVSTDTLHLTLNYNTNSGEYVTTCYSYTWHDANYTQSGTFYHHYTTAEGCASVDTLYLTSNHMAITNVTVVACDSYTWDVNGVTYTESGSYLESFEAANGCDSIITLRLTINSGEHNAESAVACDSYTWNGNVYTTSGDYVYNYTADNGCVSTDTLHLTVNSSVTATETATACGYYLWNGNAYTESGNYTTTLQGVNGCDSVVTLTLTIGNAVNTNLTATACENYTWNGTTYTTSGIYTNTYSGADGCDSTVTLALTINQPKTSTLSATACESYTWNGTNYTTSGNFTQTYTAANGCDSIVTLALTINQPAATSFTATACDSYTWNGATYTTTGSYTQNYTTVNGCDSVVTMNLTITPAIQTEIYQTSCNAYTWNGTTYTTSGNYTYTYTSASGCDSVVTLHLTVTPAINMTFAVTACDSYTWNGTAYTTSGNYTNTFTAVGGCDSVVTLILTVNNSTTGTTTEEACESYTWYGQTYTTSGNYTHTLTAANGCDSVVTLALTVNHGTTGIDNQTACGSYTWIDGQTYTVSTDTPTYTLTAANGCDSVVTLNLTVNYSYDIIDEVAACDSYIWIDNVNYTESTNTPNVVMTAANGCDSVITLNLTINHSVEVYDTIDILQTQLPYDYNGNSITAAGDYVYNGTTVSGCDSTVYLHVNVQAVGIDVVGSLDDVNIYPNPTRGRVTVTADEVVKVEVLDIVGRLVATFENTNTFDISNLGEGAYTLRITLPNGTTVRKVVKK